MFCKTRRIQYDLFDRLYCSILGSNLKNLFDLIKWQKSIDFCYFFCEFLLRFNCLIIPKYWKNMRKNMTWWEISCSNIEKIDLFKSFSEFLHAYERYGDQLFFNLITYTYITKAKVLSLSYCLFWSSRIYRCRKIWNAMWNF